MPHAMIFLLGHSRLPVGPAGGDHRWVDDCGGATRETVKLIIQLHVNNQHGGCPMRDFIVSYSHIGSHITGEENVAKKLEKKEERTDE